VSFFVASIFLKSAKNNEEEDLTRATEKMQQLKGKKSDVVAVLKNEEKVIPAKVKKIVFACDAGMGSSAMGASILRNKMQKAGLNIEVTNTAINQLPEDADIVITHQNLTDRAKEKLPKAFHISVENFLNSPKYDELIEMLKK
jgi:mannitol PTS system EIICBA or EIICB component